MYDLRSETSAETPPKVTTQGDGVRVYHTPALVAEVVSALKVSSTSRVLDCTVGEGGHAEAILEAGAPGCRVLGLDLDPQAIETATERLKHFENRMILVNAGYQDATELAERHGFLPLHGVLMDLGLSSLHLEQAERGFSFQREGPLDMRFSPESDLTAEDVVNRYSEAELARIIAEYGQEPRARRVAGAIVKGRPVRTTLELARLVESAVGRGRRRIHPATRTFQALRIEVNQELRGLENSIDRAIDLLDFGQRICIISYHSLEAKLVKDALKRAASDCICPPGTPECRCRHRATVRLITKKPIAPSDEEVRINPRTRSAHLRVAEHIEAEGAALAYR